MPMLDEGTDYAVRAAWMNRLYADAPAAEVIRATLAAFPGRVAVVSSFGADSAVLLDLVAEVDPATPVLMVETGMLFAETLTYQRDLAAHLGLSDVRPLRPEAGALERADPQRALYSTDPDTCCALRKRAPLDAVRAAFPVLINGRKRHQAATRAALPVFAADHAGLSVTPLAAWAVQDLAEHRVGRGLPAHPLVARGFASVGCAPCTTAVAPGEDPRAGRWRGREKTECGLHFGAGGAVRRAG